MKILRELIEHIHALKIFEFFEQKHKRSSTEVDRDQSYFLVLHFEFSWISSAQGLVHFGQC